eukprot:7782602-Lingulodinium_polyedra.AAC.1
MGEVCTDPIERVRSGAAPPSSAVSTRGWTMFGPTSSSCARGRVGVSRCRAKCVDVPGFVLRARLLG